MAESLIFTTETKKPIGDGSLFQRRIEFHPAKKPFLGFSKGSADFHLETLNPSSDYSHRPFNGCSTALSGKKKSEGGDFFEHGLDPELCFGITVRRIGAGLENLGNTCFLNSVLQCLTYTEPFAAYLQSGKHKSSCHTAGFCAMCAIQNHVKRALQSTGRIVAPKDLVMNLRCISRNFRNARQEDAHEYMVNLLESMHKCCLPSGVPSESPSAYDKSLVHKIFGGRLRSQVKCMQCSYCSNTFDPFLDLSLEINRADSLRKALTHFTAVEQLDGGGRQYQCQRCKQKVKALKQLTVHKAPYVLSIHLKRFGSHIQGQKIDKKVEFGPALDLKPFVSDSYEGDLKYTLYGVLVHAGWSTHSGHYYCFVRTSSGMWHSLDDNRVVQVSERTVLEQKAYMLFYVRDRRNLVPKKPIDRKENSVPSVIENRERAAFAKLKETVQNSPIATGIRSVCSSGVIQIKALDSDSTKQPQLKEASVLKITTGAVMAEGSSSLLKDPSKSSAKELVKRPATNDQCVAEMFPQSTPSLVNGKDGSKMPVSVSVAAPPICSATQSSGSQKLVTENTIHEDGKCERSGSIRLSNQSGTENNQNMGEIAISEQPSQKSEDNGLSSKEMGLAEPSIQSCKRNECVQKESLGHHPNHQKVLKPKKKLKKCRIASMHFGSKLLFKASLSVRKKKKQKRNKHCSLEAKSHIAGNFKEDSNSGGLEPSTSEKTRTTAIVLSHSGRRKGKRSLEKSHLEATKDVRHFNGEAVNNIIEGEFKERICQNSAVLASNELPKKSSSSTSVAKQLDSREPIGSQGKRNLFENGLMSMLTRGVEEFTVARWDEMENYPSQNLELYSKPSISIGYVPDEWDEEYDRGKRKKVRVKNSFDGSNPFQEIATMKTQSKKAKLDRTSSGNQPFRI